RTPTRAQSSATARHGLDQQARNCYQPTRDTAPSCLTPIGLTGLDKFRSALPRPQVGVSPGDLGRRTDSGVGWWRGYKLCEFGCCPLRFCPADVPIDL